MEYLLVCALACGVALLLWDLARRRARSYRKARELEPYAQLGEGVEGVAHDARNLLRAARVTLEQLAVARDAGSESRRLVETADLQVREAESFLRVIASRPDVAQEFDAVGCLRLVLALHRQRKVIDFTDVGGELSTYGKPRELTRVLGNLLTNALEHAGTARVGVEGREIVLANPLHGPMPGPEIYERGRSSKATSKGLGLAFCRSVCESSAWRLGHEAIEVQGEPWIRFRLAFGADGPGGA